jgi:hypothetical protein
MRRIGLFGWEFGVVALTRLLVVLLALLLLACGGYTYQASAGLGVEDTVDDVSYLARYGTWIDVEPFGTVWQPSVSPDWRPFAYGHWMWTDAGWAWVSYEPYGWLVYHYGNWDFAPDIGWFWIEGSDWSPAQVEWLNYDGYCSWAPLPPAGVEWREPWLEGGSRFWVVVRDRDFNRDDIGHHGVGNPPQPLHGDGRDVSHEPLGVHDFEKISGHKVIPEALKHGPVPVYMNPRHLAQRREMQPGETRFEQEPDGQTSQHQAENSRKPTSQPDILQSGSESKEALATKHTQADKPPVESQTETYHPSVDQQAQTRPEKAQPVQLHRMILPKDDDAKVRKYGPRVERELLVPKDGNNQPPRKTAEPKKKR